MKEKKRYIQKLSAVSVLFILVFMVIALLQYKGEDEFSLLPEQYEFHFNEGWTVAVFDGGKVTEADFGDYETVQNLFNQAAEKRKHQDITLPYENRNGPGEAVILKNTILQNFEGLTMNFESSNASVYIFLDGKMVYRHDSEDDTASGKRSGSTENLLVLPNSIEEGEFWIALEPVRTDKAASIGEVKIETRDKLVISVVVNNVADICCCMLTAGNCFWDW